jgi:hypothetical protein
MRSNIVSEVYYFKPNKDRTDVVTSLKDWAARLLKPDVTLILTEAEKMTIQRLGLLMQNNHLSVPSLKGTTKLQAQMTVTINPCSTPCPTDKETKLTKNFS